MHWSSREDGDCLVSTGGKWPQTRSNRLFVRPCYPALLQECQTLFRGHIQGVFLVGTPGIGKSVFLDYVLHMYLQDGKTALYLRGPRERAFVFRPDGTIEEHDLAAALGVGVNMADNVDVVLYDPHEDSVKTNSIHIDCFGGKNFIVAMSPDKENCEKLRKDTTDRAKLYMGTFSLQEAEALRSSCYPHVPTDTLRTRYAEIGGIARQLILRLLPNVAVDDNIDQAVVETKQKQLAALNDIVEKPRRIDGGEVASEFEHLWTLYHLQPRITEEGYVNHRRYTIELCYDDARTRIRDVLMQKQVHDLWFLYEHTMAQYGTLRGIRYETYVHKKILMQGLDGTAVSLIQNGIGKRTLQVTIPASLPTIALPDNNLDEHLQSAANKARDLPTGGYLLPHLSNFPVVDSLFVSQASTVLLQMKAGRSKPLLEDSARAIQSVVGGNLVFIVPDEVTMTKKLPGGPPELNQWRFILKESTFGL